jgi:DNA repair photolyase
MRSRGVVQLCTIVDAWSPEAQAYDLGRRCLQALLSEPGWVVRILTKNAAVQRDFDVVEKHRDRVLVGLSLTGTVSMERQLATIERNASPLSERIAALQEAMERLRPINKPRFLLSTSNLVESELARIQTHDVDMRWLGK